MAQQVGFTTSVCLWTYEKNTSGRNTIRRATQVLPGSVTWYFTYAAGIDTNASRVTSLGLKPSLSVVAYVTYKYGGVANVVRTYLEEPDAFADLDGTTARTYTDLDRFNRVIGSAWTKDLGTDRDFYSVSLSYDRDSNITDITDNVLKAGVSGNRNFDVKYDIDNLNRVTKADEGTFSGGSISNRSREEEWLLTQVGNWDRAKIDLNGDGDFVDGGGELDDTRTHNVANELLTRDTDSNSSVNYTLTHDEVGNMTDDGMSYKFVYDVFGRLRQINNQSNALVEEYRYNGLNHRLSWHYDTDGDADTDGSDKTYYFCYDDQWRIVGTFRETDSSPKERFLYHAAGLGGFGGASGGIGGYIDHVALRDRDINSGWTSAADGTLEERRYYCQNWRADVSAVLTSNGKLVEWVKYSAYGTPFALPVGDTDSDGDWDATDSGNITGAYEVRKDAELDGDVDASDITHANSITGTYQTLGRGVMSSASVANRKGYAGYENDGTITRFDHVRNRVYDKTLGRWTRRDPVGYVDGTSLYEYVSTMAVTLTDPFGLHRQPGFGIPGNALPTINIPRIGLPKADCCLAAQSDFPNAAAVTVCCGGVPQVCYFTDPEPTRSTLARVLMKVCVLEHEHLHARSHACCTPGVDYEAVAPLCPGRTDACSEAEALMIELLCITRTCGSGIGQGNNPRTCAGCNGDQACLRTMMRYYDSTLRQLQGYLRSCNLDTRLFPQFML